MKLYSRVLGGRDYSLLETVHYGLRLPATVSSFGSVRSVGISDWAVVKRGQAMAETRRSERETFRNNREIFDRRSEYERPKTIELDDLKHLSMYAFWRLFDVAKNKLVRKQREQFVALSGTGWPKHACIDHPQRNEYAKRTLLACMPCPVFFKWHRVYYPRRADAVSQKLASRIVGLRHGSEKSLVPDLDRAKL